jgi:hypothetical protein
VSIHLVKRWRRIARDWRKIADGPRDGTFAWFDAHARVRVLTECADSLERSLKIAARAKREKGGGK